MATKTLLFDYGGTLDTTALHWYYVFEKAYRQANINIADEQLRQAYVYGERYLAKHLVIEPTDTFALLLQKKIKQQITWLEDNGLLSLNELQRENLITQLANFCDDFARQHTQESALVLKTLAEKYKLIIVSNFYGNLHSVLEAYGLLPLFDDIVESAVVGVRKPDPAIWQLGVERAQCTAAECLAIGDSYTKDIVPATQVGIPTVWFKGKEWEEKAYDETVPNYVITELSQLLSLK